MLGTIFASKSKDGSQCWTTDHNRDHIILLLLLDKVYNTPSLVVVEKVYKMTSVAGGVPVMVRVGEPLDQKNKGEEGGWRERFREMLSGVLANLKGQDEEAGS